MRRQEEAEANFKKALDPNPGLPGDHEWLVLVYLVQGRVQDALVEIGIVSINASATLVRPEYSLRTRINGPLTFTVSAHLFSPLNNFSRR